MAKKIHEEMFNILSHKGNVIQDCTKIPTHPSQIGNNQEMAVNKKMMMSIPGDRKTHTLLVGM
jgi:hypothetical protein